MNQWLLGGRVPALVWDGFVAFLHDASKAFAVVMHVLYMDGCFVRF